VSIVTSAPDPTPPILFLDVDGVISLFGFEHPAQPPGDYRWINGVLHCISHGAGGRIRRLGERFELVWATGWEETANDYLPHLLGLPGELPYLTFGGRARFGTAHWKVGPIHRYAACRPAAWIDDCLDGRCEAWAEGRVEPTLLVRTRSDEGVLDRHVEELVLWADRLPERLSARREATVAAAR
jgi:hypothetical protein